MQHDWQPTDTQGHEMACTRCGRYVSLWQDDAGDIIDAPCPGAETTNRKENSI